MSPVVASTSVEGEDDEHHDETKPRERSPIETIFVYIMKQSYAASLIIMMVGLNTTMLNIEKPGRGMIMCYHIHAIIFSTLGLWT